MQKNIYTPKWQISAATAPVPQKARMEKIQAATALDLSMIVDWDPTLVYFKYVLAHAIPFFNANNASWTPEVMRNSYQTIINKPINCEHWEDYIVGHTYDAMIVEDALVSGTLAIECAGVIYRDIFYSTADDVMTGTAKVSMECYYNNVGLYYKGEVISEEHEQYSTLLDYEGGTYNGDPVVRLLGGIKEDGRVIFGASGLVGIPADPHAREQQCLYLDDSLEPQYMVFEEAASAKTRAFAAFSDRPFMLNGGTLNSRMAVEDRINELSTQAQKSLEMARSFRAEAEQKTFLFVNPSAYVDIKPEEESRELDYADELNEEITEAGIYRVIFRAEARPKLSLSIRDFNGQFTEVFSIDGEDEADTESLFDAHEHLLSDIDDAMASEAPSIIEQLDEILNNPKVPTSAYAAQVEKSEILSLPDAAFAVIIPGGTKDELGRTQPPNKRLLPHHQGEVQRGSHNASINPLWLRGAIAAYSLVNVPPNQRRKGYAHLVAHAKAILSEWQNTGSISCEGGFKDNTSTEDSIRSDILMSNTVQGSAPAISEAPNMQEFVAQIEALAAEVQGLHSDLASMKSEFEQSFAKIGERVETIEIAGRTERRMAMLATLKIVPEGAAEQAKILGENEWDLYYTTLAAMQPEDLTINADVDSSSVDAIAPRPESIKEGDMANEVADADADTGANADENNAIDEIESEQPGQADTAPVEKEEQPEGQTEATKVDSASIPTEGEERPEEEQTAGTVDDSQEEQALQQGDNDVVPEKQREVEGDALSEEPQRRLASTTVPDQGGVVFTGPSGEQIAAGGVGGMPTYEDIHEDYQARCNAQWRNKS